jgi:lipopolysaccharide biosynthesis glycosyltransferase
MNDKIIVMFCVEKGILESQAKLLIKSINSSLIKLIAVSPRADSHPNIETELFFKNNNVTHIKNNINTLYLDYPIANKVLACDFIETNFPEYKSFLFIDTDTIFLNPISNNLFNKHEKLYLRPVDNKGPGTQGLDDMNDLFWQEVFQLFDLPLANADLMTTVRQKQIRPYFNAGFIWAHRLPGFFKQWKNDFVKLVDSGLRPFGYQSRDKTDFRCLDQVALAITAQRFEQNIEILPQTYNYPIPFRPIMIDRKSHPKFKDLVHVHYHKWFQHAGFLDHVTTDEDKKTEQYLWLKQQLPLQPEISGDFKV